MAISVRVLLDVALRAAVLVVLSESLAELYARAQPADDGLGAGLTAMLVLGCAAAGWGLRDGLHRGHARLVVTWLSTGVVVALGLTLWSHVWFGGWTWSDLTWSGLLFWAGLVGVPAIFWGLAPTMLWPKPESSSTAKVGR